ncbi:bifunctional lytic transglycosylase/C40 family peptidase [Paenibacillus sp. Y412MC10]|uniref:bifunctional lytic transglycosylase/C40 family peptidase n=1 Tax=Geobacillus sp. (strain Y412MC10) TaxID=481743 RepID=UPI0011AB8033|nr:bifunctional lytic transglycosylase/C40 family peptidase [Paenibacillus sp. Y412MC10]
MNAQDMTGDAAEQLGGAGKKIASKTAKKAANKAMKFLKKLAKDFIKKVVLALLKSLAATVGPWLLIGIIAVIIIAAIISALPYADWFLGGGSRSAAQQQADAEYLQQIKQEADNSVSEIDGIEASATWKANLKATVKPSFGLPSAFIQYKIIVKEEKVDLNDYPAKDMVEPFTPTFHYTSITDDTEWTKSVTSCTVTDAKTGVTTTTGPDTTISSSLRPAHKVLSSITFDYGDMTIKPLKRYYPGGSTTRGDQWELTGTSSSGNCSTTTYRQYEHTTVDDRYVPALNIDSGRFQATLVARGVKQEDLKLFYQFVSAADPSWNAILYGGSMDSSGASVGGMAKVSASVLRYEPLVRKYAKLYGIEDQVNLLLAIIQQESGGNLLDVMQSSESANLDPNTFTDPEISIMYGVIHFAGVFKQAKGDVKLALQAYNFGGEFIGYANARGGYSKENARAFSQMKAAQRGWVRYGDIDYVDHVMQYYQSWGDLRVSSDGQIFDVQAAVDIMSKYMGLPYVWGGRTPKAGGFDCSGIIEYTFNQLGINLYGNAETQYNKTVPVPEGQVLPGDLVFYSTYKPAASHVGMYIGNGSFINSNGSHGLSISSVSSWSKLYPFLGYRRIVH